MKINKIFLYSLTVAGMLSACQKTELYDVNEPEWIQEKIDSIAAAKAANQGGEEANSGLLIDLAKYKDAFEFHGDASMLTDEIILIENGTGGKHGNYISLKEDGWLKDKISFSEVATISFDAYPTVNGSDWNYIFAIGNTKHSAAVEGGGAYAYFDGTIGFIQRIGDPYEGFFPGEHWADGNKMGGSATENPYNFFSGLDEGNCNKWYHFDYVYSTRELAIYVNGVKSVFHELSDDQGKAVRNILAALNEGQLIIGAGCEGGDLENFGGYIANFTLRNEEYIKTGNFYSGDVVPKESEIKSLTVEGPESVPFGTTYEKVLEQIKIKVAYEVDGETREQELSTSDVIITLIPDMSTIGKKTLSVYYNTTYAGKFQQNVKADLEFEVAALEISSLKIKTDLSAQNYFEGANPAFLCDLAVAGVQNNGEELTLDMSTMTISKTDADGKFTVSYTTSAGQELKVEGTFGGQKTAAGELFSGEIIGGGKFVNDEKFGLVFKNITDGAAIRTNYLSLPADKIKACAETGRLTVSFWVKNYDKAVISEWSPVFMIKNGDVNSEWSYFIFRHKGQLLVNYAGWVDSPLSADWSAENDWLNGNDNWHYVVATVSTDDLTLYVDGEVLSTCAPDGGDGNSTSGFIDGLADVNFFAIGGAQTNGWGDPDIPCMFSGLKITNTAPSAADVKAEYETNK